MYRSQFVQFKSINKHVGIKIIVDFLLIDNTFAETFHISGEMIPTWFYKIANSK